MKKNNAARFIKLFLIRFNKCSLEEKLYILSLIPLTVFFFSSYIADLLDVSVSSFKWTLGITFMVLVALGYISALTSLILRNLANVVFTTILGVLIFFYYQIIDSLSDHLIHIATGLNPDFFENSHYFINLLVGITLSSLLISLFLFPLTLLITLLQTIIKIKHKYIESLVIPRLIASFFIVIAGYASYDYSVSNITTNTQKIIVYSDYYLGSKCSSILPNQKVRYLNNNNISIATPTENNQWTFEESKCAVYD